MTNAQVLRRLQKFVDDNGSQLAAALELGISGSYLNDVLKGKRAVGPKILSALKIERVDAYKVKP